LTGFDEPSKGASDPGFNKVYKPIKSSGNKSDQLLQGKRPGNKSDLGLFYHYYVIASYGACITSYDTVVVPKYY
jgi:hypothetical protein